MDEIGRIQTISYKKRSDNKCMILYTTHDEQGPGLIDLKVTPQTFGTLYREAALYLHSLRPFNEGPQCSSLDIQNRATVRMVASYMSVKFHSQRRMG